MSEPENESEPQKISDPESYVNHRRLRTIFDIRDKMIETRRDVKVAPHDNVISRFKALAAYRALVDSFVVETEPLLRRYSDGKQLLKSRDYGQITVAPEFIEIPRRRGLPMNWKVDVSNDRRYSTGSIGFTEKPEIKYFEITGLISVVELPDPLSVTYESIDRDPNYTHEEQIGFDILDQMVRDINNFLAKIGFEVDPQEEEDTLQI